MTTPMTYEASGVDYDPLDKFKRKALLEARATAHHLDGRVGLSPVRSSWGESVFLLEGDTQYVAHVEEGLGTKELVAAAMWRLTGESYYANIAQDCAAMILNDLSACGARAVSLAMHLAVGQSEWFHNDRVTDDLIRGWTRACAYARCVWAGGETPTLKDVVQPGAAVLSGSAIGVVKPKNKLVRGNVQEGDAIVLLGSSGIHANGLTLARAIADRTDSWGRAIARACTFGLVPSRALPEGYLTPIPGGMTYGQALLQPTTIYAPVVEECLYTAGIDVHYIVNITGHGWRKLLRARTDEHFAYIIETVPEPPPVFGFLQEHGPVDDREAYGTLNMGAGYALIVAPADAARVIKVASGLNILALNAGHVERTSGSTKVEIRPKRLEYAQESLNIR